MQRHSFGEVSSEDIAFKVVTDTDGNVIVAGVSDDWASARDMLVIKYSGAGVALWTNRFDGPGHSDDIAFGLAVDGSGNVFVAGYSGDVEGRTRWTTIAYSWAGVALWTNFFAGPGGEEAEAVAYAVAVDNSGNVFVTGASSGAGSNADYTTIAYSGAGVALWTNRFDGPASGYDEARAVAVDGSGNVLVTGIATGNEIDWDYATISYSGAGVALWTNHYNGPRNFDDIANSVAFDNNGNVFVTGASIGIGGNWEYATIAYSGAGVALWTNRFQGPVDGDNEAYAVAVDGSGNVFVTGYSTGNGSFLDFATIAYSGEGVALWTNRYDGPADSYDRAFSMAVDHNSGTVFVTGHSTGVLGDADFATIAYSGAGVALWTNRLNGPGNGHDEALSVAVNNSGNVFVTGHSLGNETYADFATIAYSGTGQTIWTIRHNGRGQSDDQAKALALDASGNVFVTGSSYDGGGSPDYVTIAYSAAGVALWTNRYNGPGELEDRAHAMVVDAKGNVYVTGYSYNTDHNADYATIAYSGTGVAFWTNRFDGESGFDDYANAVAVSLSGNVFVTGHSGFSIVGGTDYTTIAYSSAGEPVWTNRYDGTGSNEDLAYAVAVDNRGKVFVNGYSIGSSGDFDYATVAYSESGIPLWTNRHDGGFDDLAATLAVDKSGNVFVTGASVSDGAGFDYLTIAYSGAGVVLWTNRYNGPGMSEDYANAVAVDASGNVFVTGTSFNGIEFDFATIAYSGAGVALWTNRYNGPGNGDDFAEAVAVDNSGNVFVTGYSFASENNTDYATIAYSGAGVPLWTNRFNGPASGPDQPGGRSALAIGPDSAVYVTGSSDVKFGDDVFVDFATVKYIWRSQLAIQPLTPGSTTVHLKLSGPASSSWSIERAVTLSGPWTNLGPSLIGTNGLGTFQDANPPAQGAFYRATQP